MEDLQFNRGKRVLEVGCGRGSLSCYFSDAGFQCALVDISLKAVNIAKRIFASNGLDGKFAVGDVRTLPFAERSFDVVFSIGLLEHMEQIGPPIVEQIRVLDEGGLFVGYVVPKYLDNIQKDYEWVNDVIKGYADSPGFHAGEKEAVFRSDAGSDKYAPVLEKCRLKNVRTSGVYPLPMISHSIDFPFSLMPDHSERAVVRHFVHMLEEKRKRSGRHPWLCQEGYGQAFLVWGYK
jgi:cyclopropane fatty-acyl-phospholipid synthase-like methyltransferase